MTDTHREAIQRCVEWLERQLNPTTPDGCLASNADDYDWHGYIAEYLQGLLDWHPPACGECRDITAAAHLAHQLLGETK